MVFEAYDKQKSGFKLQSKIGLILASSLFASIITWILLISKAPKFCRRPYAPLKPIYHWHDERDRKLYNLAIEERIKNEWTTDDLDHGRLLGCTLLVGFSFAIGLGFFINTYQSKKQNKSKQLSENSNHSWVDGYM